MRCSSCGLTPWLRSQVHVSVGDRFQEVGADVFFPLAVHKGLDGAGWIVTHVPTGTRIGNVWPTKPQAVWAAEQIVAQVDRKALALPDAGHRDPRLSDVVRGLHQAQLQPSA